MATITHNDSPKITFRFVKVWRVAGIGLPASVGSGKRPNCIAGNTWLAPVLSGSAILNDAAQLGTAAARSHLRRFAVDGDVGKINRCDKRNPPARAVTAVPPVGRTRQNG